MNLKIVFLLCFNTFGIFSQLNNDNKVEYFSIPESKSLIIVGENHNKKNAPHKCQLIREMYFRKGIRVLLMECQIEEELLINDYIEGSKTLSSFEIKHLKNEIITDYINLFDSIKKFNLTFANNDKLKIKCFNLSIYHGVLLFDGLNQIFNRYETFEKVRDLKKIIEIKSSNVEVNNKIIEKLESSLNKDSALYKTIFNDNYNLVLNVIKNKYIVNNFYGNFFGLGFDSLREPLMTEIVNQEFVQNKRILVLTGQVHASTFDNDYFYYGMSPMAYRLKTKYPTEVFTVYTFYFNFWSGIVERFYYDYNDDLELELKKTFKRSKKRISFILKDELIDSPEIYKRCDGAILLKNNSK